MRILLVSDTHGHNNNFFQVIDEQGPFDMVIHCGDAEGSEYILEQAAGCPLHIVMGNCDFFSDLPREEEIQVEGKKILITHGHYYSVNCGVETLMEEAEARDIDIAVFGHTHRPTIAYGKKSMVLNPGSLTYPRQDGRQCSYMVLELEEGSDPDCQIGYLD